MGLGRRPEATVFTRTYRPLANIQNETSTTSLWIGAPSCVVTIHLLSTLLRQPCNGGHACHLHHARLKHAAHVPFARRLGRSTHLGFAIGAEEDVHRCLQYVRECLQRAATNTKSMDGVATAS